MILHRRGFFSFLSLLILSCASATRVWPPKGINCNGSSQCSRWFNTVNSEQLISSFNHTIWTRIRDDAYFFRHDQIICAKNAHWAIGGICLFLMGNIPIEGISGLVLKRRINDLAYHGCRYCGSVPVSGNNDPTKAGRLTSNYVFHPECDGLCTPGENLLDVEVPISSIVSNQTITQQSPRPTRDAALNSPDRRPGPHAQGTK